MQIKGVHKVIRVHSGAFLLPGIAAEFLDALQSSTATQLREWKVSKMLTMPNFITGGTYLFAPVSVYTLNQL
jgi:hypothetical protein